MHDSRGEEGSDKSFPWREQGEGALECRDIVCIGAFACVCARVLRVFTVEFCRKASEECVCACGYF